MEVFFSTIDEETTRILIPCKFVPPPILPCICNYLRVYYVLVSRNLRIVAPSRQKEEKSWVACPHRFIQYVRTIWPDNVTVSTPLC